MVFKDLAKINKKEKKYLRRKNFLINHIILYVQCINVFMWNLTKLYFLFYKFTMIFLKILLKSIYIYLPNNKEVTFCCFFGLEFFWYGYLYLHRRS